MIKLALVGLGAWGHNFIKIAQSINGIRIKYICSKTKTTLNGFSEEYIKTTNYRDFLKYPDIAGVIVATPGATHFDVAKEFLQAGYNLLIEKPLTTDYHESLELLKIWKVKKPKLLVGHTQLYNPAYQAIKPLLVSIQPIKSLQFNAHQSSIRQDTSVLWDWGPNFISMFINLIDHPIETISVRTQTNQSASPFFDTAKLSLKFSNQINGQVNISWLGKEKKRELIIVGEGGRIIFDDTDQANHKIRVNLLNQSEPAFPKYSNIPPLENELNAFISAIKDQAPILSNISLGIDVVRILSLAQKSADQNGKLVSIY